METRTDYRKTARRWVAMIALMIVAGGAGAAQTQDLTMSGSGMVIAAEGCENFSGDCAITMTGSLIGQSVGNSSFAATITTDWTGPPDGSAASQCAPATGELTVTAANNATVVVTLNGLSCDIPLDGSAAQTFDGSFYVTPDSTGNLSGIKGTGRVTLSMNPAGDVMLLLHGVF